MIKELLEVLRKNARISIDNLATRLGTTPQEVEKEIKNLEEERVILGYKTIINPEKLNEDYVFSVIEVRVTPQQDSGFDNVAERIYKFPEVKSVFLMSGGYDLLLIVEGKTLYDVARFVAEKLAVLESVKSTTTHFLLKKYKEDGIILGSVSEPPRLAITP